MCMLTVFPMPELLDRHAIERLHNGALFNNDGHGWAVLSEGRILTGKSMDSSLAIDGFAQAYAKATGPALFHSRFATHGSEGVENVHPFLARKMPNTYVAHNGILPKDAHPEVGDERSDTRLFADEFLHSRYGNLDSAKTRAKLSAYLGRSNKIAVLTTSRRLRRNLYVFGLDLGEWVDGAWFSNSDHEGYGRYWSRKDRGALDDLAERDECLWCHNTSSVNDLAVCETCGTCQDCFEPYRSCSCDYPAMERGHGTPAALESLSSER